MPVLAAEVKRGKPTSVLDVEIGLQIHNGDENDNYDDDDYVDSIAVSVFVMMEAHVYCIVYLIVFST